MTTPSKQIQMLVPKTRPVLMNSMPDIDPLKRGLYIYEQCLVYLFTHLIRFSSAQTNYRRLISLTVCLYAYAEAFDHHVPLNIIAIDLVKMSQGSVLT